MQIWVDADACPKVIKDILFRAAERTGVSVTLVANRPIAPPRFKYVKAIRVKAGFDEADREIVNLRGDRAGAAELIQQAVALNPDSSYYQEQLDRFATAVADAD